VFQASSKFYRHDVDRQCTYSRGLSKAGIVQLDANQRPSWQLAAPRAIDPVAGLCGRAGQVLAPVCIARSAVAALVPSTGTRNRDFDDIEGGDLHETTSRN
jgi:hypothetical protein